MGDVPVGVAPRDAREQLERILASDGLRNSARLSRFLRFCVESALAGEESKLREHQLGIHVFDRPQSFDPRIDSIVRVEARRLRNKLNRYYDSEGRADPVLIQFRKGSYVPMFLRRGAAEGPRTAVPAAHHSWTGVAVLPFRPVGGAEAGFFADGLTQEVITALTGLENVRVVARTSSFQYRGAEVDVCRIGEELKADAVIDGAVTREGDRFRITVRLAGIAEGIYLWAGAFERDARDLLRVQEELALKIAGSAAEYLQKRGVAAAGELPANPEAVCSYRKGVYCLAGRSEPALSRALECFSAAASQDRTMARAQAGAAMSHALLAYHGFAGPAERRPLAAEALALAQASGAPAPEVETAAGVLALLFEWDWDAAEASLRRAAAAEPGCVAAREWLGVLLACRGRFDHAAAELTAAYRLDPAAVAKGGMLGRVLHLRGDQAGALRLHREATGLDPHAYPPHAGLGWAHLESGCFAEAEDEFRAARALSGSPAILGGAIGHCLARAGRVAEARAALDELTALADGGYVSPLEFAYVHLGLGEQDAALQWLESAAEQRVPGLVWLGVDPVFLKLREAPRFRRLLEATGLVRNSHAAPPRMPS